LARLDEASRRFDRALNRVYSEDGSARTTSAARRRRREFTDAVIAAL
jgi:hypothetical protein